MELSNTDTAQLKLFAEQWLATHTDLPFTLVNQNNQLELQKNDEPKLGSICVNFVSGAMAHRRQFGGGRGEAIAKAVGVKGEYLPTVVDATAGLGRDAFVLAAIGCHVTMFERHPVVAALLEDGLQRAYLDENIGAWLQQHLRLIYHSSIDGLCTYTQKPDVVYLDPMFPHRTKSALVKKEMRIFQQLVGSDDDSDSLLEPARQLANKRVVVKRPSYAPFLANQKPTAEIKTKNHRFDIYTPLK
ncbi:16S rRNA (guanine(1516)-N(2))-methyltransferase [Gilliamella apicola]|uniref:class I SAM-dependent methyltransferase n=1 Tax=Gilliamella apicola TaxID=1196095 RepID=UPI000A333245|nr:class I SAM-dependent methyltransferase [Gilliamella apicola]OTP89352.1 16S rRNA (guanine(1516)-N(2))-methyltransferase [Gilliamella apicola]OTP94953.1 16S rRNA (guanine(1516)-N(2))-methyltransferase [Gilliamella apicola]OTP96287.1 16S rRNA (guanine(1516)-N(2))-methyltransferase [Gilliamella apicola]OTQ02870.1 16S rRNA (guanine(1516)-N(2))-methyltransferase [Gilliamella apicola]OTQ06176.1 16S rRNA (guanine(1516)-N(2))-methyltransferase [Gilliamella apicola]